MRFNDYTMANYKPTPPEVIRQRAEYHMREYIKLNPGSKPRPVNNEKLGGMIKGTLDDRV